MSTPLQFSILISHTPEHLIALLRVKRKTRFLILRRTHPPPPEPGYYVERVQKHRARLEMASEFDGEEYSREDWHIFEGLYCPTDLSVLPGLWKSPLGFGFPNLTLVDFTLQDAVYWTMPILQAIEPTAPLRRIVIRGCQDWEYEIPFPFHAFDAHLIDRPTVKVLLAFVLGDEDDFPAQWKERLPMLEAAGRIGLLYGYGPNCM
jgi:hypothetical protein